MSLSAASTQTVTVVASTANDSAVAPGDYTGPQQRDADLRPGTTTQTFAVTTINDTAVESTELFKVNLSRATNATISDSEGVGTINDNDTAAQASLSINDVTVTEGSPANFTVTRSGTTTTAVSVVASTANGSATAGSDYTARTSVTLNFATGRRSRGPTPVPPTATTGPSSPPTPAATPGPPRPTTRPTTSAPPPPWS